MRKFPKISLEISIYHYKVTKYNCKKGDHMNK